jgi:hypothetical protein
MPPIEHRFGSPTRFILSEGSQSGSSPPGHCGVRNA